MKPSNHLTAQASTNTWAPVRLWAVLALLVVCALLAACGQEQPASVETLAAPKFSHNSGFYKSSFKLHLTAAKGATIYYTLDGSEPDPDNLNGNTYRYKNTYPHPPSEPGERAQISDDDFLTNSYRTHLYSKAIKIKDRTTQPDRISQISTTYDPIPSYLPAQYDEQGNPTYSFKGTPVRAMAVLETEQGQLTSPIVGHTYFIGDAKQFSLPVVALIIDETELYDYDKGRFVAGIEYDHWVTQLTEPTEMHICVGGNFTRRSANIDKASGHAVFFQSSGAVSLAAAFRTHGGCSRSQPSKSIRLYPQDKQAAAQVDIFGDGPLSGYRINLRNSGESFDRDYMRDAVIHQLAAGLAMGTQRYAPMVVFINGEYNGLLNARDRKDTRYLKQAYGVKRKQIDLLKKQQVVDSGSAEAYQAMLDEWAEADPTTSEFFVKASQQIDLDSFIDYHITSMYFAREDWPANNVAYWRFNGTADSAVPTSDGRWRWLLYDADVSMRKQNLNMLEYMTQVEGEQGINAKWATFMFRTLMANPSFKERFVIRFADLINSYFSAERIQAILAATRARIEPEMPRHIARWQAPESEKEWRHYLLQMETFAQRRPAIQRQHIEEFFKLKGSYRLNLAVSAAQAGSIELNSLQLGITEAQLRRPAAASQPVSQLQEYLQLPWQGEYFQRVPLRLTAVPKKGYRFSHWQASGIELSAEQQRTPHLTLRPREHLSLKAVFKRGS